jgi:hypothetical protein
VAGPTGAACREFIQDGLALTGRLQQRPGRLEAREGKEAGRRRGWHRPVLASLTRNVTAQAAAGVPDLSCRAWPADVAMASGQLMGGVGGRNRDIGSWCGFGGREQDGCAEADQADKGQDDHGDPVGPAGVGQAGDQDGACDRGADR